MQVLLHAGPLALFRQVRGVLPVGAEPGREECQVGDREDGARGDRRTEQDGERAAVGGDQVGGGEHGATGADRQGDGHGGVRRQGQQDGPGEKAQQTQPPVVEEQQRQVGQHRLDEQEPPPSAVGQPVRRRSVLAQHDRGHQHQHGQAGDHRTPAERGGRHLQGDECERPDHQDGQRPDGHPEALRRTCSRACCVPHVVPPVAPLHDGSRSILPQRDAPPTPGRPGGDHGSRAGRTARGSVGRS